jgi:hypothetical protein
MGLWGTRASSGGVGSGVEVAVAVGGTGLGVSVGGFVGVGGAGVSVGVGGGGVSVGGTDVEDGVGADGVQPMTIRSTSGASHPIRRRRRFAIAVMALSSSKLRVVEFELMGMVAGRGGNCN